MTNEQVFMGAVRAGKMWTAVKAVRESGGLMLCPSKERAEHVNKEYGIKTGYYVEREDFPVGFEGLVSKMRMEVIQVSDAN